MRRSSGDAARNRRSCGTRPDIAEALKKSNNSGMQNPAGTAAILTIDALVLSSKSNEVLHSLGTALRDSAKELASLRKAKGVVSEGKEFKFRGCGEVDHSALTHS